MQKANLLYQHLPHLVDVPLIVFLLLCDDRWKMIINNTLLSLVNLSLWPLVTGAVYNSAMKSLHNCHIACIPPKSLMGQISKSLEIDCPIFIIPKLLHIMLYHRILLGREGFLQFSCISVDHRYLCAVFSDQAAVYSLLSKLQRACLFLTADCSDLYSYQICLTVMIGNK